MLSGYPAGPPGDRRPYSLIWAPGGGHNGGEVIATGSPEAVARVKKSHTGRFLKKYLNGHSATKA